MQGMVFETFSLRLNWSFDGSALAAVNSFRPPNHCAALMAREAGEKSDYAVGHKGAVTVAAFNPVFFDHDKADDWEGPVMCYALGSQASLHHSLCTSRADIYTQRRGPAVEFEMHAG